jgi:hypothetical protein
MMKSQLLDEYGVYAAMDAFYVGWDQYPSGDYVNNPYPADSVNAQAFDRGCEARMRWDRRERGDVARMLTTRATDTATKSNWLSDLLTRKESE